MILQQEIAREQMAKLLEEGRTDLLTNFKSSRTGRNFKAFLVKQPDGKIGFEFEKKEAEAGREDRAVKRGAARGSQPRAVNDDGDGDVAGSREDAKKAPRPRRRGQESAGQEGGREERPARDARPG